MSEWLYSVSSSLVVMIYRNSPKRRDASPSITDSLVEYVRLVECGTKALTDETAKSRARRNRAIVIVASRLKWIRNGAIRKIEIVRRERAERLWTVESSQSERGQNDVVVATSQQLRSHVVAGQSQNRGNLIGTSGFLPRDFKFCILGISKAGRCCSHHSGPIRKSA